MVLRILILLWNSSTIYFKKLECLCFFFSVNKNYQSDSGGWDGQKGRGERWSDGWAARWSRGWLQDGRLGWVNVVPPRELQMLLVNKRPLLRNRVDSNTILFEIFLFYPCVLAVNIYIHKVAFRSDVWLSVYNFYFDKSNNQKIKTFNYFGYLNI